MGQQLPLQRQHGNAYNIFILVLTIYSLVLVALLFLPLDPDTHALINMYDNAICVVFLVDFVMNLLASRPRSAYFIGARGWLDLLGSIPSVGFIPYSGILRLARISRLSRITRLLGRENRTQLVNDVLNNRGEYATFITVLAAGLVLSIASLLILEEESWDPAANIQTGGEAIWWGIVTITTVGYGDYYPVTEAGRVTAVFVMVAGLGIIGSLASILASILVAPSKRGASGADAADAAPSAASEPVAVGGPSAAGGAAALASSSLTEEIAGLRAEMAGQRAEIAALRETLAARG
jgi:voltage-gated potassium channel